MTDEKIKILIVDDDEDICATLGDILELKGYRVSKATDGFKALELAAGERFHVVLMDIRMPGMDGVETFRKLKEIAPGTPVIMVSAYAVEDVIKEALNEGAFAALHKPLDFDLLFSTLEASMGNGGLILVVDDDESTCDVIKDTLEEKGFRVKTSPDGETAIKQAKENKFDIIILDMKLPAMNGLETYIAISEFRPKTVAIIITGFWSEMDSLVQKSIEKGAYISLRKPVDMDNLLNILDEVKKQKD